jgi:hypothetical protein
MYWNNRVVLITKEENGKLLEEDEQILQFSEVYYNDKDIPSGYCASCLVGSTLAELHAQVERFAKALTQPILNDATDFTGDIRT